MRLRPLSAVYCPPSLPCLHFSCHCRPALPLRPPTATHASACAGLALEPLPSHVASACHTCQLQSLPEPPKVNPKVESVQAHLSHLSACAVLRCAALCCVRCDRVIRCDPPCPRVQGNITLQSLRVAWGSARQLGTNRKALKRRRVFLEGIRKQRFKGAYQHDSTEREVHTLSAPTLLHVVCAGRRC